MGRTAQDQDDVALDAAPQAHSSRHRSRQASALGNAIRACNREEGKRTPYLNTSTRISRARGWLLKAMVSIVLLAWLFTRIDLAMVWITVKRLDLLMYVLLFFIHVLGIFVSALKWRL